MTLLSYFHFQLSIAIWPVWKVLEALQHEFASFPFLSSSSSYLFFIFPKLWLVQELFNLLIIQLLIKIALR